MTMLFNPASTWDLMRRRREFKLVYTAFIEEQICSIVPLPESVVAELAETQDSSDDLLSGDDLIYALTRKERLRLFKKANFKLQVEEYYSRNKDRYSQVIYSMLRSSSESRIREIALSIREGDIDFATAAINWSEGPESARGGRVGPIPANNAGHPELRKRLSSAIEGECLEPFKVSNSYILLRLDKRINSVLDDKLENLLIEELYQEWLNRQISQLQKSEDLDPIEYLPD